MITRKDFNYTGTGMAWSSASYDWLLTTPGIENAEVRFLNSFTDRYAPIQAVGDRQLIMKQTSWTNQIWGWDTVNKPYGDFGVWVQNALALLTEGGEFYLDSEGGKVYYKPLDGEEMEHIEAYLAVQEVLLVLGGTYDEPVHDISFQGISFVSSRPSAHQVFEALAHQTRHIPPGLGRQTMGISISRLAATSARTSHTLSLKHPVRGGGSYQARSRSVPQQGSPCLVAHTTSSAQGASASATIPTRT